MEISKNINKIVDYLSIGAIIAVLLLVTDGSVMLFATCPILLALVYLTRGFKEFGISLIMAIVFAFLFISPDVIASDLVPIFLISLLFIVMTRSTISDKYQILIGFLVISLILIIAYKLAMVEAGLDITKLANDLYEELKLNTSYDLKLEYIESVFALYPAMIASLSLIYSAISLRIIRNYLAYKKMGKDMVSLRDIRLDKKDFSTIIIASIILYFIARFLGVKDIYIRTNLIWICLSILMFNGMGVYDYMLSRRKFLLSRGLQWFFVIVFFYIFAVFFVIIGFADIFMDIRNKARRSYGQI
ncbi:DUF2232 domain-containing protein [Anaerococcus sp. Marseille-Q7828]|uniref:DUF2232 domain-containing protein n=1 Tax=Anaerococcus sp. Marseille-Q7828 TaxID=3036300 RepID=UPI0024ACD0FC|nr:DUF2232 domain-containing protein [Anaerococcus sp. Marseille-Q7828]